MEGKSIIIFVFAILWLPNKISMAGGPSSDEKTVLETRLNYNLIKYETIQYQITKQAERLESRIDSLKNQISDNKIINNQ